VITAVIAPIQTLLGRSRFARSVAVIAGGTAAGQAVTLLASPIITRLYSPADFGLFAAYMSLLGTASTVATLRYAQAIPLPRREKEAWALVVLAISIAGGVGLLLGLVVLAAGPEIAALLRIPALGPYLLFLPMGLWLIGTYEPLTYWAIRLKDSRTLAGGRVAHGTGTAAGQAALGVLHGGPVGLLIGDMFGRLAAVLWLAKPAVNGRPSPTPLAGVREVAATYRRFPLMGAPAGIANTFSLQVPALFLAALYGPSAAGWFSLVQRVVGVPTTLIGKSVAQVYVGELAERLRKNEDTLQLFRQLTIKLATAGLLIGSVLAILGPWLFESLFGREWRISGLYARAMFPQIIASFTVYPLSQTLIVLQRQDLQLAWDVTRVCGVVAVFAVARCAGLCPLDAVSLYASIAAGFYLVLGLVCQRQLSRSPRR